MKILFVRGNPRKNGVCERFANIFLEGVRQTDAEVFDVDLTKLNISPCRGCFACSAGDKGVCVIDDDMTSIRKKVSHADAIVCVSPVYFYSMSSQMKCFFDRCFPFVRGYNFNAQKKCVENEMNFAVKQKKFLTISVASGRLNGSFEAMTHTYKVIAQAMGFDYVCDLRRSESPYFGILGDRAVRVRKILDAFKAAGKEFGSSGVVSVRTLDDAQLQLTESDEAFAFNSKIFWQLHKNKKISSNISDDMRYDPRILLRQMCNAFDPSNAPAEASIKFIFKDKGLELSLVIRDGSCQLVESCGSALLTISTDTQTWYSMMSRRADVLNLLRDSKIILDGDKRLFAGLKRFFDFEKI